MAAYGTTEVVPFQNINNHLRGGHPLETQPGFDATNGVIQQRLDNAIHRELLSSPNF